MRSSSGDPEYAALTVQRVGASRRRFETAAMDSTVRRELETLLWVHAGVPADNQRDTGGSHSGSGGARSRRVGAGDDLGAGVGALRILEHLD